MDSAETLGYFPTPYPDEDIRSIVYRYHMRSINQNFEDDKLELFGYRTTINSALPRGIDNLVVQLPQDCGITVDSLLKDNTLFPLARSFVDAEKEQQIYDELCSGNEQQGSIKSRVVLNQVSGKVKYCPMCIRQDCMNYGEVYLHRTHQIKFMMYCPTHKVKLLTECSKCKKTLGTIKATKLISDSYCDCGNDLSCSKEILITDEQGSVEQQFKMIQELLKSSYAWDCARVQKYIYETAWSNGFYKYTGMLNYDVIFQMISEYFTPAYFESFGYSSSFFSKSMLSSIFLTKNYLYNAFAMTSLLIMFHRGVPDILGETKMSMANTLPFGVGPWNCINENCSSSNHFTIKRFHRLTTGKSVFLANFKCNDCGMIYSKSWNWKKREHGECYVISKGEQFQVEVIKLFIMGNTMKEIAVKTKSDPSTVRETLHRFVGAEILLKQVNQEIEIDAAIQIAKEIVEGKLKVATANESNKIIKHRKILKEYIRLNPHLGRSELARGQCRGSYRFLIRFDKEWMQQNLPQKHKINAFNVDELDEYLSKKVEIAFNSLSRNPTTSRIKKGSILKALDSLDEIRYYAHRKKLLITNELLDVLIESKEDYFVRNVPNICNQLKASGYKNVTLKSISSFRRSYRDISETAAERIRIVLRDLQGSNAE